jgi:uncharacterized protein (DUF736 family)
MEYDNTNKVVIFKNDQKGNEKAPSYKGKLNVEGKDYEISLWVKESDKAGKYFQGSIKEPLQGSTQPQSSSTQPQTSAPIVDDLPF